MKIPQNIVEVARQLGYPSHLFGFTPEQREYWTEPGLPWVTQEIWDNPPLGYNGQSIIWHYGQMGSDNMAPRFPKGCFVNMMPVGEKRNLVVGKVYCYCYSNQATGEVGYEIGRLLEINANHLVAKADNHPIPSIWLLRDDEQQEVWDVQEITHYASYPELL